MSHSQTRPSIILRAAIAFGFIFGLLTLYSGGSVLFGPQEARDAAGAYMPFVVWFNFLAGAVYLVAAIGLWLGHYWGTRLAVLISLSTLVIAAFFAFQIIQGAEFEMRTVGALILRAGIWAGLAIASLKSHKNASQ